MTYSSSTLEALSKLRPPFARSASILFPYTPEGYMNNGITVETPVGEPAVAPGGGVVRRIYKGLPQWQTSSTELQIASVYHVLIEHGGTVSTLIGGLNTVNVTTGQNVYRGDKLGDLFTNQLYFSALVGQKSINPLLISRHWVPQNGSLVIGQESKIRFAPDRLARDLSNGVVAILNSGIRYFNNLLTPAHLLINIAFNGDGSKVGLGATGVADTDYWNVYTPVDFLATASAACYYFVATPSGTETHYAFSSAPALYLNSYEGQRSPVFLERVAPQFSAASSTSSWDDMLKCWIGGYVGPVPYENTFRLRNLPAGQYSLYLYANQGTFPSTSTFYASVNTASPTSLSVSTTIVHAFSENKNYVKFSLTVPARGYITFKAVGYLSGMQLERV